MFATLKRFISRHLTPSTHNLDIRRPATDKEMEAIYTLLGENLSYNNFVSRPRSLSELKNTQGLGREVLGAWKGHNLVGAVFFGAAEQEAATPTTIGRSNDAEAIVENVLMIHEIATHPTWRRQGIAASLIAHTHAWANERHADLALAVPMNDASRNLFQQADYRIAPPTFILILRVPSGQIYGYPTDTHTTYAMHVLRERNKARVRAWIRPA